MIKYFATAAALKTFSWSPLTRRLYRSLGNRIGSRKRVVERMPDYYFRRVARMLQLSAELNTPKDGDRILELGTGWLHWEAVTIGLFFDVNGVLFDVWDNRQFSGLKNYLLQLDPMLDNVAVDASRIARARARIAAIQSFSDYRSLYDFLRFDYVVESRGRLDAFENEFDLVVSAGVMEHIYAQAAPGFVNGISRALMPGGYSIHSINIRDHLYLYDQTASPKQYLHYPDWVWKLLFENDVQYINRIQRSNWLQLFESAGLSLIREDVEVVNVASEKVSALYRQQAETDLTCGGLNIVHRKPEDLRDATLSRQSSPGPRGDSLTA